MSPEFKTEEYDRLFDYYDTFFLRLYNLLYEFYEKKIVIKSPEKFPQDVHDLWRSGKKKIESEIASEEKQGGTFEISDRFNNLKIYITVVHTKKGIHLSFRMHSNSNDKEDSEFVNGTLVPTLKKEGFFEEAKLSRKDLLGWD